MKKMISDCYWPSSNGTYVSHEAVCILNTNSVPANIHLTLYFEDREKLGGYRVTVGAERTKHIRLDQLCNDRGQPIPVDTPYAMVVESDQEVGVQYSRVDTTNNQLALATTIV